MEKEKIKEFADKVFTDMAGAMGAGLGYLGTKTGLFRTMAEQGPMRLEQVVRESGLQPRYVEEWLKGMACTGYLNYDPDAETYELPGEHAYLLASDGTDHFVGGMFAWVPFLMRVAPRVAEAFEQGGGVPFQDYGADSVEALDLMNRGMYEHRFVSYWLQAVPEVVKRLEAGGAALDVGCGAGHVSLTLAKAFPKSSFTGLDSDEESIRQAKANAEAAGMRERVRFLAQTTKELDAGQGFDLITACDCVHDFSKPVATLQEIHALLKPEGTLFVIEPKAADRLEDNLNPIAAMYYGFSVFHCMTQSLAQGGPGLGTCMGPARLEELIREAGFTRFETLELKSLMSLFYAVRK